MVRPLWLSVGRVRRPCESRSESASLVPDASVRTASGYRWGPLPGIWRRRARPGRVCACTAPSESGSASPRQWRRPEQFAACRLPALAITEWAAARGPGPGGTVTALGYQYSSGGPLETAPSEFLTDRPRPGSGGARPRNLALNLQPQCRLPALAITEWAVARGPGPGGTVTVLDY